MVKNIKTYYVPDDQIETIEKFEDLSWKEKTTLSKLTMKAIEEYIQRHPNIDSTFTLDQFAENDNMKSFPAVFQNREEWQKHIESLSKDEAQNLLWQVQTIGALAGKKVHHGTTHVMFG